MLRNNRSSEREAAAAGTGDGTTPIVRAFYKRSMRRARAASSRSLRMSEICFSRPSSFAFRVTYPMAMALRIVLVVELDHDPRCVLERQRRLWPNRGLFAGRVPSLGFSVALGVVEARPHVGHPAQPDVVREVAL